MHSLGSSTLSKFLRTAQNRMDDEAGRPYSARFSHQSIAGRPNRHVRHGLKFGVWQIGSKQRRLGDANDYRMHIFAEREDYTNKSLKDLIRYVKVTLRDVRIPHVTYRTNEMSDIVEIITSIHNVYYLESTIVVLPDVSEALIDRILGGLRTYDYSAARMDNASQGIFRRALPKISTTLDLEENTINIVNYDTISHAIIDSDTAYHFRAVVLFFDSTGRDIGEALQQGAKYISNQVVFVDTSKSAAESVTASLCQNLTLELG